MQYDYIVVGAGSAGCVLASRLTEDPCKTVLLVEAGRDYPIYEQLPEELKYGNSPWDASYGPNAPTWDYMANFTSHRSALALPRGKVIGGSSSINGQVFFRGIPDDYDEWATNGNHEWSYMNVLPYFRKSETDTDFGGDDFHGSRGPIPVRRYKKEDLLPVNKAFWDACVAKGFPATEDHNHPDSYGVGSKPLNNINGLRMSTSLTYLNPVRHRLNLTVRGDVLVRKILSEGIQIIGIEAESSGEIFKLYAKEVILCGGAINSPQLLMLSGIGPSTHLNEHNVDIIRDLPGVGQNLRDHPQVSVIYKTKIQTQQDTMPANTIGIRYTTPRSSFRNDMQISPVLMTSEHRPVGLSMPKEDSYVGFSVALQKALGAGTVTLNSANPHAQPLINYNYLAEQPDRDRLREAVRLCVDITSQREFYKILSVRVTPTNKDLSSDLSLDQWLLANVGTQHHSSGTCKMGSYRDPSAVVDQHCRVHGVRNLRVVDASIMPDVIRANTNATTIMIAERCAPWISDDV